MKRAAEERRKTYSEEQCKRYDEKKRLQSERRKYRLTPAQVRDCLREGFDRFASKLHIL